MQAPTLRADVCFGIPPWLNGWPAHRICRSSLETLPPEMTTAQPLRVTSVFIGRKTVGTLQGYAGSNPLCAEDNIPAQLYILSLSMFARVVVGEDYII